MAGERLTEKDKKNLKTAGSVLIAIGGFVLANRILFPDNILLEFLDPIKAWIVCGGVALYLFFHNQR
jgi:hypothetical protein